MNVRRLLPALVRTVADAKGLAGLVFQDTAPPGFLGFQEGIEADDELGDTLPAHVAYLRAHRVDPVDSGPCSISTLVPHTGGENFAVRVDIPTFPVAPERGGYETWSKALADADRGLLTDCFAAARTAAPTLPLWMREERLGFWFAPWTDPKTPVLISPRDTDDPFPQISAGSIVCVPDGPAERPDPSRFVTLATTFPTSTAAGRAASSLTW